MTERLVTTERVEAAIALLQQRGDAISVRAVYDVLQGGSFTTIGSELRAWKRRQDGTDAANADEMPEPLRKALDAMVRRTWEACNAHFQTVAEQMQQTHAERLVREQEESAQAWAEAQGATQERDELRRTVAAMRHQLDLDAEALRSLTAEYHATRGRLAALTERAPKRRARAVLPLDPPPPDPHGTRAAKRAKPTL